ncbi:MAG TPA: UDP-3-O-(3-hydroxymyristoyl)glucosamine N-acyltransferase [Bacteroidales bacterium]|jgi:UDP-3-O-[3-hydroxymyristoyl] glucosamine N-acyltransferase|nr:UDP-3-O-(3-hydroxymyristoyl)glucosamine N-acyltransferase [Bacteroidales bacterium]HPB24670.1 UDP-3-O-(3-hydroxymyristoyl)glucosamine N-acyltransferase [Bacteroidales bacterium]HQN15467.1 UDP-3-O-(3-hydroxymyristoyl)glucosamine N-acyltransferase [Bacteroidales bacterium]HQP15003.1 UDP-3-O-(3-hydroxymyristoyl)glucosamine N-acyltransferase [Bacteroidales bacterium]
MKFTAQQLAEVLNGSVEGNPEAFFTKLSKIEEGDSESLTFLANPAYTQFIYSTQAAVVIVNKDFVAEQKINATLVRVDNAYTAFSTLLEMYNQIKLNKTGISDKAVISESATIGKNVYIGAQAFIGDNAVIGDNVKVYPLCYVGDNVVIKDNSTLFASVTVYSDNCIGNSCILHSGVVIGADGFGFAPQPDGTYKKVTQTGNVVIEDDVEIGANTTIDRATLGSTIIRKGCKIDNLVMIAHNVEVGENTVIVSQTGIAGSTKIGKHVTIGGQVGIVGHISIADKVMIQAQSGIAASIKEPGTIVQGAPAYNIKDYLRSYVHFKNLPKLIDKLNKLEKELEELKGKN